MSWPWPLPIDMLFAEIRCFSIAYYFPISFPGPSSLLLLLGLSCCWPAVTSQFAGCDYSEQMAAGSTRDIFSPGYSNPYRGQVNCRWSATAPVGTLLQLQCTDVNLPAVSY